MFEKYNIESLLASRSEQSSYHVAAERSVRVEFRNLDVGGTIGPFAYDGDVILTCYRGAFILEADTDVHLTQLDQVVIPHNTRVRIACELAATIQIIWSPPHAATTQG